MKNYIAVTDGAGFVGSNLIKLLLNKTKYQTIVWMIIVQVQKKIILTANLSNIF